MAKLKLDRPEHFKQLLGDIEQGVPFKAACARAGISERAFYLWMRDGEAAQEKDDEGKRLTARDRRHLRFFQRVKKARAVAIKANVLRVQVAAQTFWTAAAWWLERCEPQDFGRNRAGDGHERMDLPPSAELMMEMIARTFAPENGGITPPPGTSREASAST